MSMAMNKMATMSGMSGGNMPVNQPRTQQITEQEMAGQRPNMPQTNMLNNG